MMGLSWSSRSKPSLWGPRRPCAEQFRLPRDRGFVHETRSRRLGGNPSPWVPFARVLSCLLIFGWPAWGIAALQNNPAGIHSPRAETPAKALDQRSQPPNGSWKIIAQDHWAAALEELETFGASNYEKIETWSGGYKVHAEEFWGREVVRDAFGARLPTTSTKSLINSSDSNFDFTIRRNPEGCRRSWKSIRFQMLTTDENRSPVKIPGVAAISGSSIVTGDDYISFNPEDPPATYAVLPNHPAARNKRAARRLPMKDTVNKQYSDLMDPREFFSCSMSNKSWEECRWYIDALLGRKGEEKRAQMVEKFRMESAMHHGGSWYRIMIPIRMAGSPDVYVTSVWSPLAGLNPVSVTFSTKPAGEGWVLRRVDWDWKSVDGVFVPSRVSEKSKPREGSEVAAYERTVELQKCTLNAPVEDREFSLTALGLLPGELVRDDVAQEMLVVGVDGRTNRLAKYHEPYQAPSGSNGLGGKVAFVLANGLVLIVIAAYVLFRRRTGLRSGLAGSRGAGTTGA